MRPFWKGTGMANPVEILLIKMLDGITTFVGKYKKSGRKMGDKDLLLMGRADNLYQPKLKEDVYLSQEERLRHAYILGATGTGKSKLLEYMIRQDILAGRGCCLIELHGDLYQAILSQLANWLLENNRRQTTEVIARKLVLIDPADRKWSVGFNPLEARGIDPYTQSLEFMGIFKRLWSDAYWGPRMEELLRNTLLTLSLNNYTLLEAKALLSNPLFRIRLVSNLPAGEVKEYWLYRYNRLSESMQTTYREPLLNRLSVFVSDPSIRAMVGQVKSTINFRRIMDQSQWLLVNLSKGRLKGNAYLLGALIVAKLQLAALSRVEIEEKKRTPFFMYVDEFQNLICEDFEAILSEARKYGLGLTLAHQNIDQLNRPLRAAILGNALIQIFFRLSHQDAAVLSSELGAREKPIIQRRLVDLPAREAFLKKKGEPPRRIRTFYVPRSRADNEAVASIKALSLARVGRRKDKVEKEIADRLLAVHEKTGEPVKVDIKTDPYAGRFAPHKPYKEGDDW